MKAMNDSSKRRILLAAVIVATAVWWVVRPIPEVGQPTTQVEQPAAKADKPTAKADKPAAKTDKPTAKVNRPAAKVERPAATTDSSKRRAAPPELSPDRPKPKQEVPRPSPTKAPGKVPDTVKQAGLRTLIPHVEVRNYGKLVHSDAMDLSATIARIKAGKRHSHRRDGGVFGNREKRLPKRPRGYYREYVHPTRGVRGPGPQRIVVGKGGEWYYTPDHYRSFTPLHQQAARPPPRHRKGRRP